MRALTASGYGPPTQLTVRDLPDPSPQPGQVLVRIEAAAINPFDLKLLSGAMRESISVEFPYVPGMDGAGTIAAIGGGVTDFAVGDRVLGFFGETPGTMAEYAVISDGAYLSACPDELDAPHAAAIPESGLTALSLLRAAELRDAQHVMVIGATGGVGLFLVQMAVAAGAQVIATANSDDSDYVRHLGVTNVIDYQRTDTTEQALQLHPNGVDVVVDLVNTGAHLANTAHALRPGGRLVSPLSGPDSRALGRADISVIYTGLSSWREPADLANLAAQASSGTLHVELGGIYALDQAPQAFTDFTNTHTRGKLVVTVPHADV